MFVPYVQDTNRWISHYTKNSIDGSKLKPYNDNLFNGESIGLAQNGSMTVEKVEPHGPAPLVPHTGTSAALRTASNSEVSLQQAIFDAKRAQIEESSAPRTGIMSTKARNTNRKKVSKAAKSNGAKRQSKAGSKQKGKARVKADLFGTPGDIFKSKTLFKKKKK